MSEKQKNVNKEKGGDIMARRKKSSLEGIIVGVFVLLVGILAFPWLLIPAIIGSIIWAIYASRPCAICGNSIKRTAYTWQIDGKKQRVCPHCNQRLEREQSRRAFRG